MDFDLTDDQRLLSDSVNRLLGDQYSFEKRKGYLRAPEGWSTALWAQYAELGLLGLPFAEEYGGFGGGAVDVMLLMQAFGRHLVLADIVQHRFPFRAGLPDIGGGGVGIKREARFVDSVAVTFVAILGKQRLDFAFKGNGRRSPERRRECAAREPERL